MARWLMKGVGGGAVPALLAGWADEGVAGPDAQRRSVAGADQSDALGDVQVWRRRGSAS